ncbi:MAG: Asp-tRNA(Asn)/Glu-tRNA(Gln) amidotransferase subunit GatC [Candidatus Wildermuthbacteria bacterium]|nr:Asp-tRNA(Asn)/Glu-tRNA(Gln) amidotransferase subunit GatC [Candidatus Wildermuthbacteria bacterium]
MISKEEVQHIAKLARIELSEEEIQKFQEELSSILDYFATLNAIDVSGIEPMTHSIVTKQTTRQDLVCKTDAATIQKLIDSAPETKDGFIRVKAIFS